MARLIRVDGTTETVNPKNGKRWTLEELQTLVGGYIELLPRLQIQILVDEEGLLKQKPVNREATRIIAEMYRTEWRRHDMEVPPLVGDVLILEPHERM